MPGALASWDARTKAWAAEVAKCWPEEVEPRERPRGARQGLVLGVEPAVDEARAGWLVAPRAAEARTRIGLGR